MLLGSAFLRTFSTVLVICLETSNGGLIDTKTQDVVTTSSPDLLPSSDEVKARVVRSAMFDPPELLRTMIFSSVNADPQGLYNVRLARKKRSPSDNTKGSVITSNPDLSPSSPGILTSDGEVQSKVKHRSVRSAFLNPAEILRNMIFSAVNAEPQGGSNYQPGRRKRSDETSDLYKEKTSEQTSPVDRSKRSLIDDTSSYLRSMVFKKIKKVAEVIDKKASIFYKKFPSTGGYYGDENPNIGAPYPWADPVKYTGQPQMNLEYVDKAADHKPHSSDKWDESPTFSKHMGEYKIYSTPSNGYATGTHSPYTYPKTSGISSVHNTKHTTNKNYPTSYQSSSTVHLTHSKPTVVHTTYSKPAASYSTHSGSSTAYSSQSGPTVVHSTYSKPSKSYSSGSSTSYKVSSPYSHVITTTSYPSQSTKYISSGSSSTSPVTAASSSSAATSSPPSEPLAEEFMDTLNKIMSLSKQGSLSEGDLTMMDTLIHRLKENLKTVTSHGEIFLPEDLESLWELDSKLKQMEVAGSFVGDLPVGKDAVHTPKDFLSSVQSAVNSGNLPVPENLGSEELNVWQQQILDVLRGQELARAQDLGLTGGAFHQADGVAANFGNDVFQEHQPVSYTSFITEQQASTKHSPQHSLRDHAHHHPADEVGHTVDLEAKHNAEQAVWEAQIQEVLRAEQALPLDVTVIPLQDHQPPAVPQHQQQSQQQQHVGKGSYFGKTEVLGPKFTEAHPAHLPVTVQVPSQPSTQHHPLPFTIHPNIVNLRLPAALIADNRPIQPPSKRFMMNMAKAEKMAAKLFFSHDVPQTSGVQSSTVQEASGLSFSSFPSRTAPSSGSFLEKTVPSDGELRKLAEQGAVDDMISLVYGPPPEQKNKIEPDGVFALLVTDPRNPGSPYLVPASALDARLGL